MHKLYFIRHGQSEDNLAGIWSHPDSPLTAEGREQARATAKAIKEQGLMFDLIVISPLPRAVETARIIIDEIGHPASAVKQNELFIERDWGALTGTKGAVFFSDAKTREDIDNAKGAEKLADLQERARQALEYLKSKPEDTILLVGHGTFGRALTRVIHNEPYTNEYLPELIRYKNGEIAHLI